MQWAPVEQSGVVSRRQLLASGTSEKKIEGLLRRRELVVLHPGVYLSHTGEPSWEQRAWAALLFFDPDAGVRSFDADRRRAALAGPSALRMALNGATFVGSSLRASLSGPVVHVAVGRDRRRGAPPGVRVQRTAHLDARVLWSAAPPRMRVEEALLDVAIGAGQPTRALGLLADACQAGLTTPGRLRVRLTERERVPGRRLLEAVLRDLAEGTASVLEHGYQSRVLRPHGLPAPKRQVREASSLGMVYRDGVHGSLIVELDGRLFHDNAQQRNRDFDRDLDVAASGRQTVRLTWGQVFDWPCATAARLARVLRHHGWRGTLIPCGPACCAAPS